LRWQLLVVAVVSVIACAASSVSPARADDAAWKASHDTDPHTPLSAYQREMAVRKDRAIHQFFKTHPDKKPGPDPKVNEDPGGEGWALLANQTPQQTSYWCGPAAVAEALGQLGVSMSQSTAASQLGTTTDGTDWSNGTGYPVPNVLNANQSFFYVAQSVSYSPSQQEIDTYKNRLVGDTALSWAPLVGDAWETAGGTYHLAGHPTDRDIFHWFDIRGYTSSGAYTQYEDSVAGASSVSWSSGVDAYSTMASYKIVTILGERGYVW